MCFLEKDDLITIILDEELLSLFNLTEREQQILFMHLVKGYKFRFLCTPLNISHQRAHQLYYQATDKMKRQLLEMLRHYKDISNNTS